MGGGSYAVVDTTGKDVQPEAPCRVATTVLVVALYFANGVIAVSHATWHAESHCDRPRESESYFYFFGILLPPP
jgi:hypothetical protein